MLLRVFSAKRTAPLHSIFFFATFFKGCRRIAGEKAFCDLLQIREYEPYEILLTVCFYTCCMICFGCNSHNSSQHFAFLSKRLERSQIRRSGSIVLFKNKKANLVGHSFGNIQKIIEIIDRRNQNIQAPAIEVINLV